MCGHLRPCFAMRGLVPGRQGRAVQYKILQSFVGGPVTRMGSYSRSRRAPSLERSHRLHLLPPALPHLPSSHALSRHPLGAAVSGCRPFITMKKATVSHKAEAPSQSSAEDGV